MAGSRKVVGSAQLRRADAFLQHGSILLRDQQEAVVALSRKGSGTIPHDCSPVFDIPLSPSDLIEAIHDCGRRLWPGEWHRISNPEEILQAAGRHYPQFRSPAWTWRR
jgi:hypothetical protein